MIVNSLECKGFRSFSRPTKLNLGDLTVLFGRNNSGKTSLARLPLFVKSSLENSRDLYALGAGEVPFASSFRDLATVTQVYPQLTYGISLRDGTSLSVELQYVLSSGVDETVEPTAIGLGGSSFNLPIGLHLESASPKTTNAKLQSGLGKAAFVEFLEQRQHIIERLEGIVHIPGGRPEFQSVYETRAPSNWSVHEVPYWLRENDLLLEAVDEWVREHFSPGGLQVDQAAFAFRLVSRLSRSQVNFAGAGRGLQSSVPVIASLMAVIRGQISPGIIVIEEPEAHVHPSAHGAIADLVIEASRKSQVVVETHSEHFVLRLRRRIAEGRLRNESLELLFLDDYHQIRRIEVDRMGGVEDWPQGVFEYDVEEARAIVEAKMRSMGMPG